MAGDGSVEGGVNIPGATELPLASDTVGVAVTNTVGAAVTDTVGVAITDTMGVAATDTIGAAATDTVGVAHCGTTNSRSHHTRSSSWVCHYI